MNNINKERKKNRGIIIKKEKEIKSLILTGKREKFKNFELIFKQNEYYRDRFCILVSSSNGGAVNRNRIKRIFREALRINQGIHKPFYDILIKPYGKCEENFKEIQEKLSQWRRNL